MTESLNGTQVPPWPSITGSDGSIWTILPNSHVGINGFDDGQSVNVIKLAYIGGKIWKEGIDGLWQQKTIASDAWSPLAGTSTDPTIGVSMPPAPPPAVPPPTPTPSPPTVMSNESPQGTLLVNASASIIDANNSVWTLVQVVVG